MRVFLIVRQAAKYFQVAKSRFESDGRLPYPTHHARKAGCFVPPNGSARVSGQHRRPARLRRRPSAFRTKGEAGKPDREPERAARPRDFPLSQGFPFARDVECFRVLTTRFLPTESETAPLICVIVVSENRARVARQRAPGVRAGRRRRGRDDITRPCPDAAGPPQDEAWTSLGRPS